MAGDIKKAELISTGIIIDTGLFHRITSINKIDKIDPFDDAAVIDIKEGNDPCCQHQAASTMRNASARSSRPS